MFFWLLRSTFTLLTMALVCTLAVTVPVGRRTLFEHAVAVFSTEPARQLGEDLVRTGQAVGSRVEGALEQAMSASNASPDGRRAEGSPSP